MLDAPKNQHRAPIRPLNAATLSLTSLGLGFIRPAPGTWGSLPPPALFALMVALGASDLTRNIALGALLVLGSLLCIVFGRYAEYRFERKDAAEVVIDETAAQCIPLLFLPVDQVAALLGGATFEAVAAAGILLPASAFLFFRAFDILKPWPAKRLESLPFGWGILADDLIAGLYAAAIMQTVTRLL